MLMPNPLSLAQHLQHAAQSQPDALALQVAGKSWCFAELLNDSAALAETLAASPEPLRVAGSNLELARLAYACSLKNWPFFPVDRNNPPTSELPPLPDTALIISTSGSEGRPRAVLLGKAQLDAAAGAANQRLHLGPGDRWLNCLPLYHIGGQAILWRCARAAACVVLHDGFVAEILASDLQTHRITHLSLVPAMLSRLLELGVQPPASLRAALIGGAALSRPLYDKAMAAGWPLYPSYGMSETAAQLASHAPADGPWHEGLVGQPMDGHEIRITDSGCIAVRGPQVMQGYLQGGGVDAEGWLTTGDLGQLDATGRLTITGRADDMLISGGRNIHPLEVESCLAACPGVRDVAVTGLPDPVWGDLIVALVVGNVQPDHVLEHARRHLPGAAVPRRLRFVEQLPRNAAGKLQRTALHELAAGAKP